MELYIGGYGQGKKAYVLSRYEKVPVQWIESPLDTVEPGKVLVFYHFHKWVKQMIEDGQDAEQKVFDLCSKYPELVVICDEVGNGIVPMEPLERDYRERLGRILIEIAKTATRVERVICGIGQRLK